MTKQRTTHALLAVVVALLGLDLALRLSPREAAGQQLEWRAESELPVRVIQIEPSGGNDIYRLWSDGTIDRNYWAGNSNCAATAFCGWEIVPDDVPPQQGARVIHIGVQFRAGKHWLFRLWSNGVIELNEETTLLACPPHEWCGWAVVPDS